LSNPTYILYWPWPLQITETVIKTNYPKYIHPLQQT